MDPWRGQLFGNIPWQGPTESFMAAIAPLAGHADELDALLDTGLGICDAIHSPLLAIAHDRLASSTKPSNSMTDSARESRVSPPRIFLR
jgi:hypothetical protein